LIQYTVTYQLIGLEDEFDIVLVNETSIAIVEVKHKAHPKLIEHMLAKKIPNFRTLFPYYQELKLYGVIASMVSNHKLIEKAKEAGLFFLTQQGNHVVLVNDKAKVFFLVPNGFVGNAVINALALLDTKCS